MTLLDQFIGVDKKHRWRSTVISAGVTAAWGLAAESLGQPFRDAQFGAVLAGAIAFTGLAFLSYFKHSTRTLSEKHATIIWEPPRRLALAAAMLVFIGLVPIQALEAEILRRRFKSLTEKGSPSVDDIESLLSSRSSLNRVSDSFIASAKPVPTVRDSPSTSASEDEYIYSLLAGPGSVMGFDLVPFRVRKGVSAPRVIPTIEFIGLTESDTNGARVGFIDLPKSWDPPARIPYFATYFIVRGHEGISIYLDWSRFKNVIFVDANIEYEGGTTSLENAQFVNCTFSLTQAPAAIRLAEAIVSRGLTNFTS